MFALQFERASPIHFCQCVCVGCEVTGNCDRVSDANIGRYGAARALGWTGERHVGRRSIVFMYCKFTVAPVYQLKS